MYLFRNKTTLGKCHPDPVTGTFDEHCIFFALGENEHIRSSYMAITNMMKPKNVSTIGINLTIHIKL